MSKIEELESKAKEGDVTSILELGHIYMDGMGVRKNKKKALSFFEMAADQKSGEALFYIAEIYLSGIPDGETSHSDYSKVVSCYEEAAKLEHFPSISGLGHLYRLGHGVTQDNFKALEIFKKGASLGNANCMNEVAQFYIAGWGVAKDDLEATRWLKKASDLGHGSASMFLGADPYCNLVNELNT